MSSNQRWYERTILRSGRKQERLEREDAALHEAVLDFFEEVASRFSHARVWSQDHDTPQAPSINLGCDLPGTATVTAYPSMDWIDLSAGHTSFEVITGKHHREGALQRVRAVLEAVSTGGFEETVWKLGGKLLRSRAVFKPPEGRPIVAVRSASPISLIVRWGRAHLRWLPYQ